MRKKYKGIEFLFIREKNQYRVTALGWCQYWFQKTASIKEAYAQWVQKYN